MKEVITIDGPSGSGKGTISRMLAQKLGYSYLDTGALYRAVAWQVRDEEIDINNEQELKNLLGSLNIKFNGTNITVNGRDITGEIRTAEIGELSSRVSAIPLVRQALFSMQRELCLQGKVVIEGRDTGTTIFPESENKFYLDASVEERARRRYEELKADNPSITIENTIEDIKKRDQRDSSRASSPLAQSDEMTHVDSTDLSINEVVDLILKNIRTE